MRIKVLENKVLKVLEENEEARKDDFVLYGAVLIETGIYDKFREMQDGKPTLISFLINAKQLKAPAFESVSRCRRHIQELRQDLKDTKTAIKREEAEEEYKQYNLTDIG